MNITVKLIHPTRFSNRETNKTAFVIHWPVMRLNALDVHFTRPTDTASYHYCIGLDGRVHHYVDSKLVAHHAGSLAWNNKSIGISLEGGYIENGVRVTPSEKAHDTCAELLKQLSKQHGIPLNRDTVRKHSEVRPHPTMCPGSTDVDYIIRKANEVTIVTMEDIENQVANEFRDVFGSCPRTQYLRFEAQKIQKGQISIEQLKNIWHGNKKDYQKHIFNAVQYVNNYDDLRATFVGNRNIDIAVEQNYDAVCNHYILHRAKDKRTDQVTN